MASLLLPLPARAELQRFRLSPDESHIATKIADPFGGVVEGTFRLLQGEAQGDADRLPGSGSVALIIDAGSYNSAIGLRDQDVQEYYLEVKRFPAIRFNSTALENAERLAPDTWQIIVRGRLDLHGVQREIAAPMRLRYEKDRIVAQGSLRLSLTDFDIAVPRLLFWKAGDRVEVNFRFVGERQP